MIRKIVYELAFDTITSKPLYKPYDRCLRLITKNTWDNIPSLLSTDTFVDFVKIVRRCNHRTAQALLDQGNRSRDG